MADLLQVVFVTARSKRHQEAAAAGAPEGTRVTMLHEPTRERFRVELADAHVLISERTAPGGHALDAALIASARHLRLIQRLGSMIHDIDLDAARKTGVAVCTWPVHGCVMVAEHMLMQMLAVSKRLVPVSRLALAADDWGRTSRRTDENVFAYNWTGQSEVGGLMGQSVGIWGFGEIGVELARRLIPFAPAQVLYHKRRQLPADAERELNIVYTLPEEMLPKVDFLCVLLPYSAETDLALDAAVFGAMKRGAFVVHCGSGGVIDENALAQAVRSGHLGGAALDTFECEPLRPDNPMVQLGRDPTANVLLTPHTAAATRRGDIRRDSWTNVRRLLAGEPLLNRVV